MYTVYTIILYAVIHIYLHVCIYCIILLLYRKASRIAIMNIFAVIVSSQTIMSGNKNPRVKDNLSEKNFCHMYFVLDLQSHA